MIELLLAFLIKSYLYLNIFQQSFYEEKNIFKYIKRNFIWLNVPTLLIIFNIFFSNLLILILIYLSIFLQILWFYKRTKRHLKFTKRIIRMWIFCLLMYVLFIVFKIGVVSLLFTSLIVILSKYILLPLDNFINKKYLRKAKNKLGSSLSNKIAITGSYGKTSVKNYIGQMLDKKYLALKTPHSFNTPLGIAKFINSSSLDLVDFIIYEFGSRRNGDIKELSNLYYYDIAVVTEIGYMHVDTFKSIYNIIEEKMSILDGLSNDGFAILNYENEYIRNYKTSVKKYTYGFNYGDYQAKNIKISIFNTKFDLYVNDIFIRNITINLLGRQSILNVMPAIILCDIYQIDLKYLGDLISVDNRLSLRKANDFYILDDAYNSNIVGAKYALEILGTHPKEKFIITPGFVEMDLIKDELVLLYALEINKNCDVCILEKNDFTLKLAQHINIKLVFVNDFKEAFKEFMQRKSEECILLIENDLMDAY